MTTEKTEIWEGFLGFMTLLDYTNKCYKGDGLCCKYAQDYIAGSHHATVKFHLSPKDKVESGTWKVIVYDKNNSSEKVVSEIKAGGYICGPALIIGLTIISLGLIGFWRTRK